MFGARGHPAMILAAALMLVGGCASHQPERRSAASMTDCSRMHASYKILGQSGSMDFSVAHHETRWIPLTSSKAPLNLEISASLDDAGKLQVMVRTDGLDGGGESQLLWLGPPPRGDQFLMFGQIVRPRSHIEPGVAWPEYDLLPGVEVIGTVFAKCLDGRGPGSPPDWNSFTA